MFNILLFVFISLFFESISSESLDSPKFEIKENTISWEKWLNNLKIELKSLNLKSETVKNLNEIKFNSRVVELDKKQPEFKLTFNQYLKKVITPKRVKRGKLKFKENLALVKEIENKYQVSSFVIISLWGIETSYGKNKGKFDVLNSLASLSYDGRRANFFLKELKHSLKIIDEGHISRKNLKGSWAGAFGHTQFMPSTFINYAQDFDKDGKKDLLNNYSDALASGAYYLSRMGWKNDVRWGEEIKDFVVDDQIFDLSKKKVYKNENFWKGMGIPIRNSYSTNKLRIVIPDKSVSEVFLVTSNFDVILNWNRSNYFALAVSILSDALNEEE